MGNTEITTIKPMNKQQFLEFFRDECENAFINHVVEQDIFVYSMVRILLRALLDLHGGNSLPSYSEINTGKYYESFNREEYISKLCEVLNKKTVKDFKGRISSGEFKSSSYYKLMGQYYLAGAFQSLLAVPCAASPEMSVWYLQNVAPNAMGYSFSDIAQDASDKFYNKKDKKKRIASFFDAEDLISYFVNILPKDFGLGKNVVTAMANAGESVRYFMKMHKQEKKEDDSESRRIASDLKHKFVRQKNNRKRYQTDKKTIFSMLLFAYKHALDFLIEI